MMALTSLAQEGLSHLKALLALDTTNPPGKEIQAVRYLERVLRREGFEPVVLEPEPGRGNLVVRLRGDGSKKPLLLASHLDVVAADSSGWGAPPFAGQEKDGYLVGRGALDMKHMTAMSLMTLLALRREGFPLRRDVIFAAVADEECGGEKGAGFLVREHPGLIRSEFALGEVGGFRIQIQDKNYFLVQTAERGCAWCRVRFKGESGHGSLPLPNSAINQLVQSLTRLRHQGLPRYLCDPVRRFVGRVADSQKIPVAWALRALLHPLTEWLALSLMKPTQARLFYAQLHPTASPTLLNAGEKENVHPAMAEVVLDGRVLPGQSFNEFRQELQLVLGENAEIELLKWMDPLVYPDKNPLLDIIERVLKQRDPGSIMVPSLNTGYTDAKHYDKLGIMTYGFVPMLNDPQEPIPSLIHGKNERIGVEAFGWGVEVLLEVVRRFCGHE
jgi:acetylornithine deacetylase/succinyl-diaminopimelate desuccinylase-like protein